MHAHADSEVFGQLVAYRFVATGADRWRFTAPDGGSYVLLCRAEGEWSVVVDWVCPPAGHGHVEGLYADPSQAVDVAVWWARRIPAVCPSVALAD